MKTKSKSAREKNIAAMLVGRKADALRRADAMQVAAGRRLAEAARILISTSHRCFEFHNAIKHVAGLMREAELDLVVAKRLHGKQFGKAIDHLMLEVP